MSEAPTELGGGGFSALAAPSDNLITAEELATWSQRTLAEVETNPLAQQLLWGVSVLLRDHGNANWTRLPSPVAPAVALPDRARLIGILTAKRFYTNPEELKSDHVGPLTSTYDIVEHLDFTEAQRLELARLAGTGVASPTTGYAIIDAPGTGQPLMPDDYYFVDPSGSDWMIPWVRIGDHLYPAGDY